MKRPHAISGVLSTSGHRRGAAAVAIVLAMLVLGLVMIGMVMGGARDQDLTIQRVNTLRAFYATEAALNMGIREVIYNFDDDSDGGVGSISNDGNPANDLALGSARVYVSTQMPSPEVITLTSHATSNSTARSAEATFSAASGFLGFGVPFAGEQQSVAFRQIGTKMSLPEPVIVLSMSAYINGPAPKEARYAIYNDSSGEPSSLIVQSDAEPVGGDSAHFHWFTHFMPSTSINPGDYWMAIAFENTSMEFAFDAIGGQTRMKDHDAVALGYTNPWGASSSSSTQRFNIYMTAATQTTGNIDFSGAADYDNTDPQGTGTFRDLSNPTRIVQGNDISANAIKFSAINFTAGAGIVSDCVTAYDTAPATADQTNFTGSIRVFADVLVTGTVNSRRIGLAALVNEVNGQEGLALVLHENGNQDALELYRLPQNGNLTGAVALATSDNFNGITQNNWYRLVFDVMVNGSELSISGRVYSHTTASNPTSGVNVAPLSTLSYTNSIPLVAGLQTIGEVAMCFDTTDAASRGSVTNFQINSGIATSTSSALTSWTEKNPY